MHTRVPGDHVARRVEHDDAVVFDVAHDEVKNLIAAAKLIADGWWDQDVLYGCKKFQTDLDRELNACGAEGPFGGLTQGHRGRSCAGAQGQLVNSHRIPT